MFETTLGFVSFWGPPQSKVARCITHIFAKSRFRCKHNSRHSCRRLRLEPQAWPKMMFFASNVPFLDVSRWETWSSCLFSLWNFWVWRSVLPQPLHFCTLHSNPGHVHDIFFMQSKRRECNWISPDGTDSILGRSKNTKSAVTTVTVIWKYLEAESKAWQKIKKKKGNFFHFELLQLHLWAVIFITSWATRPEPSKDTSKHWMIPVGIPSWEPSWCQRKFHEIQYPWGFDILIFHLPFFLRWPNYPFEPFHILHGPFSLFT